MLFPNIQISNFFSSRLPLLKFNNFITSSFFAFRFQLCKRAFCVSSSAAMTSRNSTAMEAPDPHAPLLRSRNDGARAPSLALLLGRAAGRRGPSVLVRETAARELEERRADWGYSKPVVALDMSWNMAFVVVSAAMLACTVDERPNTPIRVWIVGYALQCLVHVVLVWLEYRRRCRRDSRRRRQMESDAGSSADGNDSDDGDENSSGPRWVLFHFVEVWLNCYLERIDFFFFLRNFGAYFF